MPSLVRTILPVLSKNRNSNRVEEVDDDNAEYSFALEYEGPPLGYDIPHAVPVSFDSISTASLVSSASVWDNSSLPVIQPISRTRRSGKRLTKDGDPKLRSKSADLPAPAARCGEIDSTGDVFPSCAGEIDRCCEIRPAGSHDEASEVSDTTRSSGTLGFSDSREGSVELSGSSDGEILADDAQNGPVLENHMESSNEDDRSDCGSYNGKQMPGVTFRDPETSDIFSDEDTEYDQHPVVRERRTARADVKKGLCHKCLKGSRLTEKEFCLVCNAKYCSNCVLRAMGSMPEGRKCILCIGYPIEESNRGSLGKCSRMLKKMFTDSQVKKIMSVEKSCEMNQLPPEFVYVNGKALCHEELAQLRNCQNPPKKLIPGRYWYDKVSGLWGKEGKKPCQFISPQLAVGDTLKREASNGNMHVVINGREITKSEFLMLQLAGVHLEGNPHFWVRPNGSYQEEGQKMILGRIWNKPGMKLVSAVLSLPIPLETANLCEDEDDNLADKVFTHYRDQDTVNKFLLVGCDNSGTSTIFKQAKIVYNVPFSEDERQNIKLIIQSNLYRYIGILLEGREKFEEELLADVKQKRIVDPGTSESANIDDRDTYSISPKLKAFSNWLLQGMVSGNLAIFPAAAREYAPLIEELWKDKGFQAAYKRRNELQALPLVANYFLDRAVEISKVGYEPSNNDILYAEGISSSNGIASVEFAIPRTSHVRFMEPADQNEPLMRCQLIRVHANSLGENCKWLEMFEDVDLVIYCVSLTDYDEFVEDADGALTNKMLASKRLFESIVTHPAFAEKDFLLVLNKFDLLEKKILEVPLTQCEWFRDFNPVLSHNANASNLNNNNNNNSSLAQRAFHYIAVQFKRVFQSLTERKLYVSQVIGLEPESVDDALKYGSEILKWDDQIPTFSINEISTESVEVSTSS